MVMHYLKSLLKRMKVHALTCIFGVKSTTGTK